MSGRAVSEPGRSCWPSSSTSATGACRPSRSGLRGALLGLLGEGLAERLTFGETLPNRPSHDGQRATLEGLAERVREVGGTEVGVAVEARERGGDTAVTVAVVTPEASHRETRVVFLGGSLGRGRAAVAAAAILASRLRAATVAVS